MNKRSKTRYLYSIAVFLSILIITIPFYTSNVMAVVDEKTDLSDVKLRKRSEQTNLLQNGFADITGMATAVVPDIENLDPGQACIEKNKKTHFLVELLDNDVISVLEKIAAILHAISAIWTAIKSVLAVVIAILLTNQYTKAKGLVLKAKMDKIDSTGLMFYINQIVGCAWATWCTFKVAGQSITLDPYWNIYLAIGCLCPSAILFNMRKLKTIYQTYNCCVEQACTNGMSTVPCEKQLSEATCMYWGKGALAQVLLKVVMGIITQILARFVITPLLEKLLPDYAGIIVTIAWLPFEYKNLIEGMKWMQETFNDPTCEDLNFAKLKKDMEEDFINQNVESTQMRLVDTDNDGIGDTLMNSTG